MDFFSWCSNKNYKYTQFRVWTNPMDCSKEYPIIATTRHLLHQYRQHMLLH